MCNRKGSWRSTLRANTQRYIIQLIEKNWNPILSLAVKVRLKNTAKIWPCILGVSTAEELLCHTVNMVIG